MKTFSILAILVAAVLLFSGCVSTPGTGPVFPVKTNQSSTPGTGTPTGTSVSSTGMKAFSSWDELSNFLRATNSNSGYGYGGMVRNGMALDTVGAAKAENAPAVPSPAPTSGASSQASSYSQTNIQVAGVDEADMVKNDGKYIYTMGSDYYYYGVGPFSYSGTTGTVTIVDAYPAAQMSIASKITFDGSPTGIFVYNNTLVVFGNRYENHVYPMEKMALCLDCIRPPFYSQNFAFMAVYDISDRANPKTVKEIEVKGSYVASRMINGKVYGVFSDYAYYDDPVPLYTVDGVAQQVTPSDIAYFDYPDNNYNFNIFISQDLNSISTPENRKIMLMGAAENLYVSQDSLYVTYTKYDYYYPQWDAFSSVYGSYLPQAAKDKMAEIDALNISDWRKDNLKMADISDYAQAIAQKMDSTTQQSLQQQYYDALTAMQTKRAQAAEKTEISKIALSGFSLLATGDVPGHILNQYSMDEAGNYFRIATTVSQQWGYNGNQLLPSSSGVYVLDSALATVGVTDGIAPGEQMYSVRFMGDKAYMVTFQRLDPFFVIDLSNPQSPQVVGRLKLPGYSSFLQPYDETHIIGIGKETADSKEGDFAWYEGVKLSLFDVSDIANPKEVAKVVIGDRGSDSQALNDPKAILFDKSKNGLLVLPILEAKIDPSKYANNEVPQFTYGDPVFQGAYVFSVSPDTGFTLRGKITHVSAEEMLKMGNYFYSNAAVQRSLYIDNYLYTVSDIYVKANDLSTLADISSVQISNGTQSNGYPYPMPMVATAGASSGSSGVAVSTPAVAPAP